MASEIISQYPDLSSEYSLIAFFQIFNIMHMHVMFRLLGGKHPPPKSATAGDRNILMQIKIYGKNVLILNLMYPLKSQNVPLRG